MLCLQVEDHSIDSDAASASGSESDGDDAADGSPSDGGDSGAADEAPGGDSADDSDDDEASIRSGDIDSGAESDGYGDEGLSWEAVLASVQQPGTAGAPAAEAATEDAAAPATDAADAADADAAAAAVPSQPPARKVRKKPGRYRSGKPKLKGGKRKR